jgi:hypothetical protein
VCARPREAGPALPASTVKAASEDAAELDATLAALLDECPPLPSPFALVCF